MVIEYCPNGKLIVYGENSHVHLFPSKLHILRDIAAGLQYLHSRNVTHCDLKCDNILVSEYGRMKITDFGISQPKKFFMEKLTGTIVYSAPEQLDEMEKEGGFSPGYPIRKQ